MCIRNPGHLCTVKETRDMKTVVEKPKIFGTGLITLDLIMGPNAESPVQSRAGGTCGNVLMALAYLGWEAFPIARMNDDPASRRVKADMKRWGMRLKFSGCNPTSHTPIIVQEIRSGLDGIPTHRFSWICPRCGEWLPGFRALTLSAVDTVAPNLPGAAVFFMDRLSPAALKLAARASSEGVVVMFELSSKADPKLFTEALSLAHIVKYADQRIREVGSAMQRGSTTLVEIQTLGARGLRYRHRFDRRASGWTHMEAVPAPRLADSCGAGDWCTAGLLAKAASHGLATFRKNGEQAIYRALRYGQALAAWNCGFEGARGGMYAIPREDFDAQIDSLLKGSPRTSIPRGRRRRTTTFVCPACPS